MEIIPRPHLPQEKENPSPLINSSPHHHSHGSLSITNNGGSSSSSTPKTISSRSEANPYPTTFVQADTSTFKQVVQMLTGSSETAKQASRQNPSTDPSSSSPSSSCSASCTSSSSFITTKGCIPTKKKQGFKLYERRNSLKNGLMISPLLPGGLTHSGAAGFSPRKPEILSPSILDFPSLVISSPVTPLTMTSSEDPFHYKPASSSSSSSPSEEEKAIAEKNKFYLLPSPRTSTTPGDSQPPQLLPLFPVTSPKISGSSSSSSSS